MTIFSTRALTAPMVILLAGSALAQPAPPPASPPPSGVKAGEGAAFPKGRYRDLDQLPDWGGAWFLNFMMPAPGTPPPPSPKLKGAYKARYDAWRAEIVKNDGVEKTTKSNCSPPGMPVFMQIPQYPFEYLFTPGRVTINQEAWMQTRHIWTDGRAHEDDPDPSFFGDSVGHWEGDVLVVETIGIKEDIPFNFGMYHSEKMKIKERIRLKGGEPNILQNSITIEDPDALEEPFNLEVSYRRDRYGALLEFQCSENDRNPVDAEGNTLFDGVR